MIKLSMRNLHSFVGQELGVSAWCLVDQARIDAFAACTGDTQWIHTDPLRAAQESPFGSTIAHGYLTLSLTAALSMELGLVPDDASAGLNYGLDKLRFLTPVLAGDRVRLRVVVQGVEEKTQGQMLLKTKKTLEIERDKKIALVAESLSLLIP